MAVSPYVCDRRRQESLYCIVTLVLFLPFPCLRRIDANLCVVVMSCIFSFRIERDNLQLQHKSD